MRLTKVLKSRLFCNPANKEHDGTHTSINHAENHLVLYNLRHPKIPNRAVEVDNQFGKARRLKVGQAMGLFVPSQKFVTYSDGSTRFAPTTDLDHFKCYNVKGESIQQKVQLGDEVSKLTPTGVYAPVMLCNPVMKIHAVDGTNATRTGIENPEDHLVCYRVKMAQSTHKVRFHNQFESRQETVFDGPNLLCVPSLKRHLDGGNSGNGGKGGRGAG